MSARGVTDRGDTCGRDVVLAGPPSQCPQCAAHVGDRGREHIRSALRETVLHGRGRVPAAGERAHLIGEARATPT